ncbi:MAG: hypothetical protein ACLT3H_09535 [Roseburia sp.]
MKPGKRYIFSLLAGLACAGGILWSRGISEVWDLVGWSLILCDAFTVSGSLLFLVGGLLWAGGKGAFDGLGFVRRVLRGEYKQGRAGDRFQTYRSYCAGRPGRKSGSLPMFLAGGTLMIPGLVFMILYYGVR